MGNELVWVREPDWIYIPGQDRRVNANEFLEGVIQGVVVPRQCESIIYIGDQGYACLIDWSIDHGWHEESGWNHEGRPYHVKWRDELEHAPTNGG